MLTAYVRRKQFEAKLLAVEVGKLFGGGGRGGANDRISSDDMLRLMGVD